jgi:oligopeptide/dipeptide ABC transporter ATP-binding protein
MSGAAGTLLSVENLSIGFDSDDGFVPVVEEVDFVLATGRTLALVGESGCGKSLTALALLGLLPPFGRISSGTIRFDGQDLVQLNERSFARVRGNRISMIFQEPMSALNPVFNVGSQVAESLILHRGLSRRKARVEAVALLATVGIPDPADRAASYPHQLSGGMRQRVLIAMALACEPDILIADEPTTALDVTIQAQIMDLMLELQERLGMAILFISHDFGVVSRMADEIAVMYGGRIVETAPSGELLGKPRHPYTQALLRTTPRIDASLERLPAIPGRVPTAAERPRGCCFHPRCTLAVERCRAESPVLRATTPGHAQACHVVE